MTTPAPVTPTLSITADKAVYNVGDVLTLTATYSDSSVAPVTLHVTASASDAAGNTVNAEVDVTVNTQAQQAMQIGVSDSFGDSYTQVSNEGGVAVLTTTIGTPPAAPAA
jgi:hypothetical protein